MYSPPAFLHFCILFCSIITKFFNLIDVFFVAHLLCRSLAELVKLKKNNAIIVVFCHPKVLICHCKKNLSGSISFGINQSQHF